MEMLCNVLLSLTTITIIVLFVTGLVKLLGRDNPITAGSGKKTETVMNLNDIGPVLSMPRHSLPVTLFFLDL